MCEYHKHCDKCKEQKNIKEFKNIDNIILDWCEVCCNEYLQRLEQKNKKKNNKPIVEHGYKYCFRCEQIKNIFFFAKNNKTKDGLACYCKECNIFLKNNPKGKDNKYKNHKTCSECNSIKSNDEFQERQGTVCKKCNHNIRSLRLEKIKNSNRNNWIVQKYTTQICKKCLIEKPITEFKKTASYKQGYTYICKSCIVSNRTKKRDRTKETEKNRIRMETDPLYRTMMAIHSNIYSAFKSVNLKKNKTCDDFGIDREYIAKTIGKKPGKNYQLDHIIPINAFNFNIPEQIRLCYSIENLRWIPQKENSEKTDKIIWDLIKNNNVLLNISQMLGIDKSFDGLRISYLKKVGKYGEF